MIDGSRPPPVMAHSPTSSPTPDVTRFVDRLGDWWTVSIRRPEDRPDIRVRMMFPVLLFVFVVQKTTAQIAAFLLDMLLMLARVAAVVTASMRATRAIVSAASVVRTSEFLAVLNRCV
jgi:hypothetical protein